jgi:PhnB protein
MKIPEGHQTVMPYFIVDDANGFFEFAANVFGAELTHPPVPPDELDGHCEMRIGPSTIMFAKCGGPWKARTADLFVYAENADDTYRRALDAGATTVMEIADQNYGRSGGVTDPFGNVWWITSVTD